MTTETAHTPAGDDYVSDRKFSEFPLSAEILKGIMELEYEVATPVQAACIEPALAGRDMVVRAKTGTGKTAAFCIPLVERLEDGSRKPQAIVLAPTRELAQQISEECDALAAYRDLSVVTLVGGLPIGPQTKHLKNGAEIIVGTPGRVLDHIGRGNLPMDDIRISCLDEADEMLSMGFFEDVNKILSKAPEGSQVLLFSATVSPDTERLVARYLTDPEQVYLSTDADQVEGITHVIYEPSGQFHKVRSLLHIIDIEDPDSAIVFCNTREDTATVAAFLDRQGLDVQLLSGELPQKQRSKVMAKVKRGEVHFLIATDVAARGIDISDLSHVINYSLPQDPAVYLHRTGRTGRIGKKGTAISLFDATRIGTRNTLQGVHKIPFEVRQLPDAEASVRTRVERQAEQIRNAMGTMAFEAYLPTVRALREREDGDILLAAALRAFFQWDRQRRAAASDVDSLRDLDEAREEQRDRKRSKGRGGRDRDRDRGDRGDRGDRRDSKRSSSKGDRDGGKRKRSRKKGGRDGGSDSGSSSKPQANLTDLDALLSVDNG